MANNRILIVAWAFHPSIGGMEEESYLLAKELVRRGFEIDVFTEKHSIESPTYEKYVGINIIRTSYVSDRGPLSLLRLMLDILLFSIINSGKYKMAIVRGAFTFEPLYIGFLKFFKIFRCKTWVTADTGGEMDEIILLKKWKLSTLFIFFAKQHNYYNSICEANFRHYYELGFDRNKMTFIKNGIEIPKIQKNKKILANNYLYLGRLEDIKGIKELLVEFNEVAKTNRKLRLYVGGGGSLKKYLISYVKDNKLENIIFYKGIIDRKDKDKFFELGNYLILPSKSEAFALVVYEAILRGKNVIATDVADLRKDLGNIISFFDIGKKGDLKSVIESRVVNYIDKQELSKIADCVDIRKTVDELIKLNN